MVQGAHPRGRLAKMLAIWPGYCATIESKHASWFQHHFSSATVYSRVCFYMFTVLQDQEVEGHDGI